MGEISQELYLVKNCLIFSRKLENSRLWRLKSFPLVLVWPFDHFRVLIVVESCISHKLGAMAPVWNRREQHGVEVCLSPIWCQITRSLMAASLYRCRLWQTKPEISGCQIGVFVVCLFVFIRHYQQNTEAAPLQPSIHPKTLTFLIHLKKKV